MVDLVGPVGVSLTKTCHRITIHLKQYFTTHAVRKQKLALLRKSFEHRSSSLVYSTAFDWARVVCFNSDAFAFRSMLAQRPVPAAGCFGLAHRMSSGKESYSKGPTLDQQ